MLAFHRRLLVQFQRLCRGLDFSWAGLLAHICRSEFSSYHYFTLLYSGLCSAPASQSITYQNIEASGKGKAEVLLHKLVARMLSAERAENDPVSLSMDNMLNEC